MSDSAKSTGATTGRRRDAGMTLPELLIAVLVSGMLVAVMASASQVVLGQQRDNVGRINNTRSEQSIGTWLPSDLASAETVDTDPGASPCGTQCPAGIDVSGSNTLMLTWTSSVAGTTSPITTVTTVSYRYVERNGVYDIIRVSCLAMGGAAPTCTQITVLHDVPAPPAGEDYIPGVTAPIWVMLVSMAADPADPTDGTVTPGTDPTYSTKNGRRVTVTIHGGGTASGSGQDQITLTAGGTDRVTNLSTTLLSSTPTFAATRSRCGGNLGLIVDTSGSIGTNMASMRNGVTAFIDAFAGTPVKLQVVAFASTATTLGAGSNWTRYFDMLVESDVAALKSAVAGLQSTGYTNYEDALFRMFRTSTGSVQEQLPNTLVFFTDGVPTYNRLSATSASSPAVVSNDDAGLPAAGVSGSYNQVSWNRANRVLRTFDADLQRTIGVFVGSDVNGSSSWLQTGAGYHLEDFQRGYHTDHEQGFRLINPQRGYRATYQYAASGLTYYLAGSGLTYQFSTSGLTYQVSGSGLTYEVNSGGVWTATTRAIYEANNVNNTSTDNYRVRVTGTLGTSWVTTTKALFDKSNSTVDAADGFRVSVTGTVGSGWTNTTKTLFDLSNTVAGSADGYRVVVGTPGTWTATTKAYYDLNNVVAGDTDGFYVAATGTPGTWVTTTKAYFDANNTSADSTDGYKVTKYYSAPYSEWESVTDAAYLAGNTTSDATDGWDATVSYSAPFTNWGVVTESTYAANNTTSDASDGWRVTKSYAAPYSEWEPTTESSYTAGNTVWGSTDGWTATKSYTSPYTMFDAATSTSRTNASILKELIAPGGVVPAQQSGGSYTNAAEATYYELPAWDQFAGAMTSMALAECGGTLTMQTKVGSASAADPFTYQNSIDLSTATTSTTYRSGTFDFDLAGGASVSTTITPLNTSDITQYRQVGWTCRAGGVDYPFTTTPIGNGWTSITLTVSPNQAISCVNQVELK